MARLGASGPPHYYTPPGTIPYVFGRQLCGCISINKKVEVDRGSFQGFRINGHHSVLFLMYLEGSCVSAYQQKIKKISVLVTIRQSLFLSLATRDDLLPKVLYFYLVCYDFGRPGPVHNSVY